MRSIWNGAISFSLINLPVKLGSSVKDNHLGLRTVRKADGSPLNFTRIARADGKEVPWGETAKAYDAPNGDMVLLDRDDFEAAYGKKNRVASVLMFTDAANIPEMAVKSAYWVQPDTGGERTYALLASVLQSSRKVAVITFAMREREAVAVLRPRDGFLSLETLEWNSDMLTPDFARPEDTSSEADHQMALALVEAMTDKYDHSLHTDKSSEAVMDVIQRKIETGQVIKPPPVSPDAPRKGMPADLTASLQAAVDAQKNKTTLKRTTRKAAA